MVTAQKQTALAAVPSEPLSFSADGTMAEAARAIFAGQLAIMRRHEPAVRRNADPKAIHETRKAIRRLRTAFRLFRPYFEKGILKPLRRNLKQSMRQMGRSRDLTIFRRNLKQFMEQTARTASDRAALAAMLPYWQAQQDEADARAQTAVARAAHQRAVAALLDLANTAGMGARPTTAPEAPAKVRHLAPVHITERLAAVRGYDDYVDGASVTTLHRLRIQFKELRYTLEFFFPILGPLMGPLLGGETGELVKFLDQVQDHLGDLNDARVALELLQETPDMGDGAYLYRAAQEKELARLAKSFNVVWATFDDPSWRYNLATALAAL